MKTKYFEITCSVCGSKNVTLWDHHSAWEGEDTKKLKCGDCRATETL